MDKLDLHRRVVIRHQLQIMRPMIVLPLILHQLLLLFHRIPPNTLLQLQLLLLQLRLDLNQPLLGTDRRLPAQVVLCLLETLKLGLGRARREGTFPVIGFPVLFGEGVGGLEGVKAFFDNVGDVELKLDDGRVKEIGGLGRRRTGGTEEVEDVGGGGDVMTAGEDLGRSHGYLRERARRRSGLGQVGTDW
jgi:hypothetical protein